MKEIDGLTQPQAKALLHKHLTGDFGWHSWITVSCLLQAGYLAEQGKIIVVTAKGKEWCDKHHLEVL